jgi:hypothetical protein
MVYVSNSFALSMLSWPADIRVEPASLDEVREGLAGGFTSAVGHEATARVFSTLLGVEVPVNRVQLRLNLGELLYVGQVMTRLPEGRVLSQEELAQVPIAWARVQAHKAWAFKWAGRWQVWMFGLPPGLFGYTASGDRYLVAENVNRELGLPVDTGWRFHPEHPWLGVLESDPIVGK